MVKSKWSRPKILEQWTKLVGAKKGFDFELTPVEILYFSFPYIIDTNKHFVSGMTYRLHGLHFRVVSHEYYFLNSVSFPISSQCLKTRLILDFLFIFHCVSKFDEFLCLTVTLFSHYFCQKDLISCYCDDFVVDFPTFCSFHFFHLPQCSKDLSKK